MKYICALLILLVLCSCTHDTSESAHAKANVNLNKSTNTGKSLFKASTFVYECERDFSFVARVEDPDSIWLFLPNETLKLPHVQSASGAKYQNAEVLFWNKGNSAMLEGFGTQYKACLNNRMLAVWEHSKLNGFDYRAVGNEPGWVLEISEGKGLVFQYDYGQSTKIFPYLPPKTDNTKRQSIYTSTLDKAQIEVLIKGQFCQDTMADQSYESAVTINFNGKQYHGCGKSLH